ncbi:MAG: nucleotide exchange factor GrpE [Pseudohongiellaceae bacterium]
MIKRTKGEGKPDSGSDDKPDIELDTESGEQSGAGVAEPDTEFGGQSGAGVAEPDTEFGGQSGADDAGLAALLEQARDELAHAQNDLLRVQAEMQNLRRRTEQDVEKAHKYGQEGLVSELLGVVDNLERALEAASDSEDETVKAIHEGVNLTLKSFMECFKKIDVEVVDPHGEPFDPRLHQAMATQEHPEVEPNTVVAVMQKGYTLHGRVIRPAMVMVSK